LDGGVEGAISSAVLMDYTPSLVLNSLLKDLASLTLVDSAPSHQEIPKPPSGGFLFGLTEILWGSMS
jgi:hypothetical protein